MVGADAKITAAKEKSLSAGEILTAEAKELAEENAITFKADFKGKTLEGNLDVGCKADGEGSFLRLTEETLEVYKLSGGKEILVHSEENRMNMKELVMLRIHVRDGKASIALVSSGEKNYVPHASLYKVEAEWNSVGSAFATAEKTDMTDADLKFAVK
jgi:hypothetical protein